MRFLPFYIGILFLSVALNACSNDEEANCDDGPIVLPNAVDPIDGAEYRQSLMDCRLPRVQTFLASNIEGAQIMAAQGTILFVNPQTFIDVNGEFIDGDVTISLIEMYEPGEIIACQLSTNGITTTNLIEPIFSESMFYIDITYQDRPVTFLQPIRVFAPSDNLGIQQFLFSSPSCPELECTVLWEFDPEGQVFEEPIVDPVGNKIFGYSIFLSDVGWKDIGRYNTDANTRTTVYNKAPNGYNKSNANVFIHYNTPSTAIGLFERYDTDFDVFTESFGQLPVDTAADVVFVTVQNNQYVFGTNRVTITQDLVTATLEPSEANENNFINAINNL